jgi:vacuolar-type H+-ATPase subunit F/Vma7
MGRIAVLGDRRRIQALAIAGVEPHPAGTDEDAVAAWQALSADVSVLILTLQAATALAPRFEERPDLLVTVLP